MDDNFTCGSVYFAHSRKDAAGILASTGFSCFMDRERE
jgi:hypothetical protein